MLDETQFNEFCQSLKGAAYVMQWGGSHVWKVGGKVFAIGNWHSEKYSGITFKVSEIAYEILKDQPGLRPAPYLASRNMKWIQHYDQPGLADEELTSYLKDSYDMIAQKLSKAQKRELEKIPRK